MGGKDDHKRLSGGEETRGMEKDRPVDILVM